MLAIGTTKNKNEGRRRFSDEQIRFLEYVFETQSRPELRMKQQVANKLGLHPHQVAIWFQNRRARSKSRQTELEYNNLQQSYDTLASKSESLKEENQALLNQLQMLRELAKKQQGNITTRHDFTNKSSNKELSGMISLSMTNNSTLLSENYNHQIVDPFKDNTSYAQDDGRIIDAEDQSGSLVPDHPNWWEF
ncbi:leucine zipper, homeobox-associated, Homeodomain-like protein [Artemisia annua]|uniref:Homeobox-leucine zipper protein n=1 Tax=Artemisia annua TaxID=35608 RepID=A0A2U1LR55_ARTAN|nr:leucine zipper, homeobox-associated, Homeodomain-like protein [Artemisia annua]